MGDDFLAQARALGMTYDAVDAFNLLLDDGVDPDKAAYLVVGAVRGCHDPVQTAEHIIALRRALQP
jgi:hypothetical protein